MWIKTRWIWAPGPKHKNRHGINVQINIWTKEAKLFSKESELRIVFGAQKRLLGNVNKIGLVANNHELPKTAVTRWELKILIIQNWIIRPVQPFKSASVSSREPAQTLLKPFDSTPPKEIFRLTPTPMLKKPIRKRVAAKKELKGMSDQRIAESMLMNWREKFPSLFPIYCNFW